MNRPNAYLEVNMETAYPSLRYNELLQSYKCFK